MSRDSLQKLFTYFLEISKGNSPVLKGSLKKCNAAVRSGDIYDTDDFWGIELRFNHFQTCSSEEQSLLSSSIKNALSSQNFPIRLEHIKEYFSKSTLPYSEQVKRTWFRGTPLENLDEIHNQRLKRALSGLKSKTNINKFEEIDGFQDSRQILFFDWHNHPILKHYGLNRKTLEVQLKHIEYCKKNPYTIGHMALFFRESGIKNAIEKLLL